jgi:tRNA (guanosine-2'-O-)-methyltransferase
MNYEELEKLITRQRLEKIQRVVSARQRDFTLILENVHDPHNLGAVLRTAESTGIHEIYALYTVEKAENLRKIAGHRSSS